MFSSNSTVSSDEILQMLTKIDIISIAIYSFLMITQLVTNSIDLSQHLLDTVEFEENNVILLREINLALMIPNPSLDCSYVVLNFWPNLSLVVLIKLFL